MILRFLGLLENKFFVSLNYLKKQKAPPSLKVPCLYKWAHLGLNQGPPDYEREKYLFHQIPFVCICLNISNMCDFLFETKWYLFTFI